MKTNIITQSRAIFRVLALTFCATSMIVWTGSTAAAAETKKSESGFGAALDQWQEKMSEKFRDTWKGLRGEKKESGTAALDLREDSHRYTLRLNLPERDLNAVEIKMEGGKLHIVAPSAGKAGRYEQTIALAGADPTAEPAVDRRPQDHMIVVTVPKSSTIAGNTDASRSVPDPSLMPWSQWDRNIFDRMETMRREMDRAFDESFRGFRDGPGFKGFFDEARFGSSVDIKEEGENYVVHAYLPSRDVKNVNVTVEQQSLRIEAKEQESTKQDDPARPLQSSRMAAYSQLVTLPGPVQADKMRVEKKEGLLVVTLPKATQT